MNSLYSPYGAYELKAVYQRNGLKSSACVIGLILLGCLSQAIIGMFPADQVVVIPPPPIIVSTHIRPAPPITRADDYLPQPTPTQHTKVGIPKPVPDEMLSETDSQNVASQNVPDIVSDGSAAGTDGLNMGITDSLFEYIVPPDSFVPVEREAIAIYEGKPEYPRAQRETGLEGTVLLWVLVSHTGAVKEVRVHKSSGITAFDEAATIAAYQNKYQPAIQNGRAIDYWLGYKIVFQLEN